MRKIIIMVVKILASMVISFLIASFITADINFVNWDIGARYGTVVMAGFIWMLLRFT